MLPAAIGPVGIGRLRCKDSHWGGLLRERIGRLDVATGRLAGVACLMAVTALYNPA